MRRFGRILIDKTLTNQYEDDTERLYLRRERYQEQSDEEAISDYNLHLYNINIIMYIPDNSIMSYPGYTCS